MRNNRAHPIPAVSAILIEDDSVLLVQRGVEPNKGLWSLPGGSIEWGETAREACAREMLEETGLTVEVGEVAAVHEVITPGFHYVIIIFRACVVSGELQPASDAADARWVPLDQVGSLPATALLLDCLAVVSR